MKLFKFDFNIIKMKNKASFNMLKGHKINIFMYKGLKFRKKNGLESNSYCVQPPYIFSIVAILFRATGRLKQTVR